jgi:hypothetical protein
MLCRVGGLYLYIAGCIKCADAVIKRMFAGVLHFLVVNAQNPNI